MDRLLDLSNNSIQYGNSICPSMIRKLKVIVYFWQSFSSAKIQIVLLFSFKFNHFLNLRACKNDIFFYLSWEPRVQKLEI